MQFLASAWFTASLHGANTLLLLVAFSSYASTWSSNDSKANIQAVFFRALHPLGGFCCVSLAPAARAQKSVRRPCQYVAS